MPTFGTSVSRHNGNTGFRDSSFSPAPGKSLWEDCPLLAHLQDPSVGHLYYNDFHSFTAADWTITTTETGGGSATEVITDEAGGVLLVTNDDGDDESDEFQLVGEAYQLAQGKPLWLEGKFKLSDVDDSDFFFGLTTVDTTLIDGTQDGVWFQSDDGDANLDYHADKDTTESTGDTGIDLSDNTYVRLGITWDGVGTVNFWVDGVIVSSATANIIDDELVRISFAVQNGSGSARTLSCDYIKCFQVS